MKKTIVVSSILFLILFTVIIKDVPSFKMDLLDSKTSEKILVELKKIESYELDLKIKEYKEEIENFCKSNFGNVKAVINPAIPKDVTFVIKKWS